MTKDNYEKLHRQIAHEYSTGLLSFEQMKAEIKKLEEDHAHEFQRNAYGESVCWCGAVKD